MSTCDLLITSDLILTQDEDRRIIENGAVAITGDTIDAVGPIAEIESTYSRKERIDLKSSLLMPGLVNCHTHVPMTLLRGMADDLPLMKWLNEHIFPAETNLTPELVEMGALLGIAEMLACGTTAFKDMYLIEDSVGSAVRQAGIRAVLGEVVFAFPSKTYENVDQAWDVVKDLNEKYGGSDLIRTAVMPHAVYTTTPEILTKSREVADELGVTWHIHLAETKDETAQCLEKFKLRPVPYLDSLGLLDSKVLIAHAVDLTDDEIALLAEKKVKVAHNPESNMKLASGISPISKMLEAGITVGLGTDGAASNNNLNMFEEMSNAALLQKVSTMDPTSLPAQATLDMATLGSAGCLAWDELGAIAPGHKADLVSLDISAPNMNPMYSPTSHIVYAATGAEVQMTMVGGKILFLESEFKTFDYYGLIKEAKKAQQWILDKIKG